MSKTPSWRNYYKGLRRIKNKDRSLKKDMLRVFSWKHCKNPTEAEKRFKDILDKIEIKYKFQPCFYSRGKSYICDFVIEHPYYIVFEIDGEYHNEYSQQKRDKERSRYIAFKGYSTKRFSNQEVMENPESTKQAVEAYLKYKKELNCFVKNKHKVVFFGGEVKEIKPAKPLTSCGEHTNNPQIINNPVK